MDERGTSAEYETGDQFRNQGETEIPIRQQEPESPSGSGVTDTHKAKVPKLLEFLTSPTASSHNSVALMERGEVPPSAGDGDHPREEAVWNTLNANGTMTRSGTQAILPGTQDNVERMPSTINSRAVSSTTPGVLEYLSNEERVRFQESVNQICQILSRSTAVPAVQGLDFNSLGGLCQVLGPDRPNIGDDESPNIPSAPNAAEKPLPLSHSNESRSHLPRLSDGQELSPDPASTTELPSHFQPEPESSPDVPMPDAHHTNAPPRLEYPMSLLASSHHSDASMVVIPSVGTGYHPPEDAAAVDSDGNVTMGGTEALSTGPQGDDERYSQAHGEVSLTSKMTSVSGQEPALLAQSDNSQLKGNNESQSTLSRPSEGQALPQGSERTTDIASYVQQEPSTPESYHTPVTPVTWRQIDYPMTSSPPSGNEVAIRGQGDLALSPSAETGAMEDAAGMMDPSGNQIVGGELVPWVGQDHNAEGSSRRRLPIKFGRYGRNGSKWRRFHLAQNTRNLKVKSFSKKLSTTQEDKKLVSRNDKSVEQQGIKLALANSRPRLIHGKMGRTVVRKMSTVSKSQAVQRNNRRSGRIAGRDSQWSTSRALTLRNRASNDPHSFTVTVVPSSTRDFTSILPFPFGEEPPSLPISLSTLAWPAHSVDEVTSLSDSGDRNCDNQSTDGTNIHSPRPLVPDTESLSTIEGKRHHPIWEDDGKEGESRKQWLSSRELEYTGDMETDDVDPGIAIRTEGFVPGSRATYSNGSNDSLPMQAGALSQTPNNTPKQPDSNQARPTRPHSVQRSDASPLSATKSDRGVTAPYESTSQTSALADVQGNSSTHLEAAQEATPTKQSPCQTSIVSPPTASEVIEENLSPPRPITDPPTNDKGKAAVRNLSPPPLAMEEAAAHHLYPFNDVVLVNTHPQGDPGTQDYPLDGSSLALREKRSLPCAAGDTFVDPLNESHNHNPGNGSLRMIEEGENTQDYLVQREQSRSGAHEPWQSRLSAMTKPTLPRLDISHSSGNDTPRSVSHYSHTRKSGGQTPDFEGCTHSPAPTLTRDQPYPHVVEDQALPNQMTMENNEPTTPHSIRWKSQLGLFEDKEPPGIEGPNHANIPERPREGTVDGLSVAGTLETLNEENDVLNRTLKPISQPSAATEAMNTSLDNRNVDSHCPIPKSPSPPRELGRSNPYTHQASAESEGALLVTSLSPIAQDQEHNPEQETNDTGPPGTPSVEHVVGSLASGLNQGNTVLHKRVDSSQELCTPISTQQTTVYSQVEGTKPLGTSGPVESIDTETEHGATGATASHTSSRNQEGQQANDGTLDAHPPVTTPQSAHTFDPRYPIMSVNETPIHHTAMNASNGIVRDNDTIGVAQVNEQPEPMEGLVGALAEPYSTGNLRTDSDDSFNQQMPQMLQNPEATIHMPRAGPGPIPRSYSSLRSKVSPQSLNQDRNPGPRDQSLATGTGHKRRPDSDEQERNEQERDEQERDEQEQEFITSEENVPNKKRRIEHECDILRIEHECDILKVEVQGGVITRTGRVTTRRLKDDAEIQQLIKSLEEDHYKYIYSHSQRPKFIPEWASDR
ncbi:uncharacterized protein N7446_012433 [Penicillium canescens]|uniref:uncharacterized protein n=1 Tax=Penicillium canescens TaxID=5083 RepID=UPI0026DF17B3|nr:uncharacterized protein N7446_012433 [Penicillium canescens]KAJ6045569.1 hypothetical protein N7446_012433 [Penicillium canescens]